MMRLVERVEDEGVRPHRALLSSCDVFRLRSPSPSDKVQLGLGLGLGRLRPPSPSDKDNMSKGVSLRVSCSSTEEHHTLY